MRFVSTKGMNPGDYVVFWCPEECEADRGRVQFVDSDKMLIILSSETENQHFLHIGCIRYWAPPCVSVAEEE